MTEIVAPVLYMLTGVCGFAGGYFFINGLRKPRNRMIILFGAVGLLIVPFAQFQIAAYHAETIPEYINALRANIAAITLLYIVFLWFIAEYTGVGSRRILWTVTAWGIVLFLINLQAPLTIQYAADFNIKQFALPWGETLAFGIGKVSVWFSLGGLTVIGLHAFWIYALVVRYRQKHERTSLLLALAIFIQAITSIQGILVREGFVTFLHLGPIGFLVLVIIMSLVLEHQSWHRLRTSENRFRQLIEQCPLSIQVCSPDGKISMVNPGWSKLWNMSQEQIAKYNIFDDKHLIEKGAMPYIQKAFAGSPAEIPAIAYNPTTNGNTAGLYRDRWICAHIYPVKDDINRLKEVILIHEDVTEKKYVEDAIRNIAAGVAATQGNEFFQQLMQSLARLFDAECSFIAILDEHDPTRMKTLAMYKRGKYIPSKVYTYANTPSEVVLQGQTYAVPQDVQLTFPNDQTLIHLDAESFIGAPLKNTKGEVTGLIAIIDKNPLELTKQIREILEIFAARASTELQRLEAEAATRRMAYVDYVTGLGSRPYLHERLAEALSRARRQGKYGAVLLIDLDHFKMINDALGHDIGDQLLRAVGQRINDAAGARAFVARFGGDEFVALLDTETNKITVAEGVATSLYEKIHEHLSSPIILGERALTIGASIGIVIFPANEKTELDIIRHADIALNSAKQQGRGRAQFYLPALQAVAAERLRLDEGLRNAIASNELTLYFQPQINAKGEISGTEALLRWHHPELHDIAPATFIPIAEETGLIHSLGRWVLSRACSYLTKWQRDGVSFGGHLSINVSAWQFIASDFVAQVSALIESQGVDPHQLTLELTETALLYDLDDSIAKMKELRTLGIGISLDDFGTGYSSLAYLKDLPLDQLKIDKTFVAELETNEEAPLIQSIIAIGRHMNLLIIAEGVETTRQKEILESMGSLNSQGYLYSRPLPEADYIEWLDTHKNKTVEPTTV